VNQEWIEANRVPPDKIHELIGLDIAKHQLVPDVLCKADVRAISGILDTVGNCRQTVDHDIVSGPLDADKMDYLLRDSYFCGVKYGVFDLERLVRALVQVSGQDETYLGIRSEDVPAADQYVIARYNMTLQVYGHKTRVATDLMLNRAVLAAIEEGDPKEVVEAYTYEPDCPAFAERYLEFDDWKLMEYLARSRSKTACNLAARLKTRLLPARVFCEPIDQLVDGDLREKLKDTNRWREAAEWIEREFLSAFRSAEADCVFVEVTKSKPVSKFADPSAVDPEHIFVYSPGRSMPQTLAEVSGFFGGYKYTGRQELAVYANLDPTGSRSRDDLRQEANKILCTMLLGSKEGSNAE
jgi:HD superfamily phosphohydrolase